MGHVLKMVLAISSCLIFSGSLVASQSKLTVGVVRKSLMRADNNTVNCVQAVEFRCSCE